MTRLRCFAPVCDADATVLILGSMPGQASLAAEEYYAHPRNHFWTIMGELFGASPDLPYQARLSILRHSGIALWDVLGSCVRSGSLDADIEAGSMVANDFNDLFRRHRHIKQVFFNGAKAEQCFRKQVLPGLASKPPKLLRLPSTSPANAGLSYDGKLLAWRALTVNISVME